MVWMTHGSRALSSNALRSSEIERVSTSSVTNAPPDFLDEAFPGDNVSGVGGQAYEHLHHLGFDMPRLAVSQDSVQFGLDKTRANPEITFHVVAPGLRPLPIQNCTNARPELLSLRPFEGNRPAAT
jgi:hypothetical protein